MLDDAADEFFGAGALIESLAPKARATFIWKIGVRLGNKALVIAPTVRAEDSAVLGAQPAIVSRKGETQAAAVRIDPALYQPLPANNLPIYELDEEEQLVHEAADAALGSIAEYVPPTQPPIAPSTPPPDQPEPAPPPDQPAPVPEPGVPVPEPTIPAPPEEPPTVEPAARVPSPCPRAGQ